ncbi:MAG: hypothetical protein IMX04_09035 [Candidatus Carbobacillus altaicus]|nr:hypothetical protein [Candidatus Carbobacillus altaicus]
MRSRQTPPLIPDTMQDTMQDTTQDTMQDNIQHRMQDNIQLTTQQSSPDTLQDGTPPTTVDITQMMSLERPQAFRLRIDARLGLALPQLTKPLDAFNEDERQALAMALETLSGLIPERLRALEGVYVRLYRNAQELEGEPFFKEMQKVVEIADTIAELNVLFLNIQGRFLTSYQGG